MKTLKYLLLALFVTTCLAAQALPRRIVSLAPAVTKSVILLGGSDLLVGCSSFCEQPAKRKIPVVASVVQVNMEAVLAQKPDLVIVSSLNSRETVAMFRKLGIRVEEFAYPKSFDQICNDLVRLGMLIGKKPAADREVASARKRLAAVRARIPKQKSEPKVFMQIGANPLFTVVPNTFMDDFIRFAGGVNIASDLSTGSISRETVLARNPDVIFIVAMGTASADERSKWLKYKNLRATASKKIFLLDDDKTCSPTPALFVEVLQEMVGRMWQ
ncbi:MAG: helical backbone metal receptor [Prevotellaceae bacterium]|jgi:iron complex transport system substrate-binding protein|nr:helical backbone metal receptor [Prevotellaceae bacterium]